VGDVTKQQRLDTNDIATHYSKQRDNGNDGEETGAGTVGDVHWHWHEDITL
jgi:hypothetical protein